MLNTRQAREITVNRVHDIGVDNFFNEFYKRVFVINVNDMASSISEDYEVSPKRLVCFFQNDLVSEAVQRFVCGFYSVRKGKLTMHRGCIGLGLSL